MQMATSPYIQLDDIDIDLDDDDDREHFIEDNNMIDDATENLDFMQQDNSTANQDDPMGDGAADEDLLDFEDDYDMNPYDQGLEDGKTFAIEVTSTSENPTTQEPVVTLVPEETTTPVGGDHHEPEGESNDEEAGEKRGVEAEMNEEEEDTNTVYIDPDSLTDRLPDEPTQSKPTAADPASTNHENSTDTIRFTQGAEQDAAPDPDTVQEPENEFEEDPALIDQLQADEEAEQSAEAPHDATQETATVAEHVNGGQRSPSAQRDQEPTHLHPVTVNYLDQEYALFPPEDHDDDTTYLLQDSALATQPFEKLLAACRDLIGEGMGHDDEIVIDIPTLGLHICQDSKYAAQITLAQVIDTYMLLSQNEQLSTIEPLYCRLSHRVCLESQMAYLINSAHEGKSYTAIAEEHADSPDEEQTVEDNGDATTYFEAADAFDDHEALNDSVEIEESEQDVTYDHKDDEPEEQRVEVTNPDGSEFADGDQASAELSVAAVGDAEVVVPEEMPAQAIDLAEQKAIASSPSHTFQEDNSTAALQDKATAHNTSTETQDHQATTTEPQSDLEEEEDLFADDQADDEAALPANITNGNHDVDEVNYQNGDAAAAAADELIEWDEEEQPEVHTETAPPATPSKTVNGKRKLEPDDDDLIDIEDDDTPNAKRTRSS